jgi:FdhE protein
MTVPIESKLYLNLCQQIGELRSTFVSRYQDLPNIPEAEIDKRLEEKRPLLDIPSLQIDKNLLHEFSQKLFPILEENEVFDREDIEKFLEIKGNLNSSELVRLFLMRDLRNLKSLSGQYKTGADLLWFIGLSLSQTMLQLYANKLKSKVDKENWLKGNCPICGSFPAMEKFRREDGKRILWCGLCGTEWHFKRIMCPFCDNEDHNSLRYFFVEGNADFDKTALRVDVCDRCKRYIKTLDERKLPESEKPELYMENLNTVYLDVLAQKDGYKSPTFWMITLSEEALD